MWNSEDVPRFATTRYTRVLVGFVSMVLVLASIQYAGTLVLKHTGVLPVLQEQAALYLVDVPYVGTSTATSAPVSVVFAISHTGGDGALYEVFGDLQTGTTSTTTRVFERREYVGPGDVREMHESFEVSHTDMSILTITVPNKDIILRTRITPPN